MGAGGNGNNQWEWEGNGNETRLNLGSGTGMNHWKWERMGLKKTFPLTSDAYHCLHSAVAKRTTNLIVRKPSSLQIIFHKDIYLLLLHPSVC